MARRAAMRGSKNSRNHVGQLTSSSSVSVKKDDKYGKTYGGVIAQFSSHQDCPFTQPPKGPVTLPGDNGTGAQYSTAQEVATFNTNAGTAFVNGSATALPFVQALAGANSYFALGFQFNDLDQEASFAGLFDQYRFDKVELRLVPRDNSPNTMNTASPNATIPQIMVAMDFDDSAAPSSMAYIRQYDNVQSASYGDGVIGVTLKPSYTPAVYSGGAFTGYSVESAGWIDAASNTVPHYGIKGVITALTGGSTQTCYWNIHAKYFLSFRNTH